MHFSISNLKKFRLRRAIFMLVFLYKIYSGDRNPQKFPPAAGYFLTKINKFSARAAYQSFLRIVEAPSAPRKTCGMGLCGVWVFLQITEAPSAPRKMLGARPWGGYVVLWILLSTTCAKTIPIRLIMISKNSKLLSKTQNTSKRHDFPVSPPQAPIFSRLFPPHSRDPGGEIIISPPFSEPWGGSAKNSSHHMRGKKNTPGHLE